MPTVLRIDGYRFFFYSLENNEPAHIHIEAGENVAKYWLHPVIEHRLKLQEAWDAHFSR